MQRDALVMAALRPKDPQGYALQAIAWHELGHYEDAIVNYSRAIELTHREDPQYAELTVRLSDVRLRIGEYDRAIFEAKEALQSASDPRPLEFRIFCALLLIGDYQGAVH